MSIATEARAEYERMMRLGDEAMFAGIAPELLVGPKAEGAHAVAESYRATVEQLEAAEGIGMDGRRIPTRLAGGSSAPR